jgi:phage major head subunit gpT-like protein
VIINQSNMQALFRGFKVLFNEAFQAVKPTWNQLAMEVPSNTRENAYPFLAGFPKMREWVGDRVIKNLKQHDYTIRNKPFEATLGVDRDTIEDDTYGVYNPIVRELGRTAAVQPDELVWGLLPQGFTVPCYDGKAFFATNHPVGNGTASNHGGGSGTPWYLFDMTREIKPLIFQNRRKPEFVSLDKPDDYNVVMKKEFIYGVDSRCNVGFALWQLAYASKQALNDDNYAAARAAMMGFKNDDGQPLGIKPTLMVVGPSQEGAARKVLLAERNAAGETNVWQNTAALLVVPWLT